MEKTEHNSRRYRYGHNAAEGVIDEIGSQPLSWTNPRRAGLRATRELRVASRNMAVELVTGPGSRGVDIKGT